jgi:hypothetical protein
MCHGPLTFSFSYHCCCTGIHSREGCWRLHICISTGLLWRVAACCLLRGQMPAALDASWTIIVSSPACTCCAHQRKMHLLQH